MMTPDLALIAEVMLQAEGFKDGRILAKKTTTLYGLMVQQLSKQDHYDFGLRSLKAVLNMAGSLKRADPDLNEETILLRALRDMNMPKFIKEDAQLFKLLLGDLFPSMELPVTPPNLLHTTIEEDLLKNKLAKHDVIVFKTIQLHESQMTRHCNMLVGQTCSGKSTAWRTLQNAKSKIAAEDKEQGFQKVQVTVLNPKSVTVNEIYGVYDLATFEWVDGILSTIVRNMAQDERKEEKWVMLDGPVDTLWIESMNSVMDDNKVLTLINGDRITLTASMALLFEVQDLSVASPATVSRAGMVYFDVDDLGWEPYVTTWLEHTITGLSERVALQELFEKWVARSVEFKYRTELKEPVPITDFNGIRSLCRLYYALRRDCTLLVENENATSPPNDKVAPICERIFVFSLVWSYFASVDFKGRVQVDSFIRGIDTIFPPAQQVYDYAFDFNSGEFKLWEERNNASWRPAPNTPFYKIIVPTVDTLRNAYVLQAVWRNKHKVLLVGSTGTGKTVLAQQQLDSLPDSSYNKLVINFSSATTSLSTQEVWESMLEKKSMQKFAPHAGKEMMIFIDDMNMPKKDQFGSQPPLELIRQWSDYGCWYDRGKQALKYILDCFIVAAMGPPGGGRSVISQRLQSQFHLINFTMPNESQLRRIFDCIVGPHLVDFNEEVKTLAGPLVQATINLYKQVEETFLPSPEKCHYLFNMRDMAKVVQGIMLSNKKDFNSRECMIRLWIHEASCVFSDRLVSDADRQKFVVTASEQCIKCFGSDMKSVLRDDDGVAPPLPMFTSILSENGESSYMEVADMGKLKNWLEEQLEDYNVEPGVIPMDLVLFGDAISHVCRIHRVLKLPRGNLMLVGVGGSGRQSLTRLSSFLCEYKVFQIEITKQYRKMEFHEDLKALYISAGVEAKTTTFLFSDTQLKEESFLEDINNILSSGEVPGLFPADEKIPIFDAMRPIASAEGIVQTPDKLWEIFINRVRDQLHVVICMSPIGEGISSLSFSPTASPLPSPHHVLQIIHAILLFLYTLHRLPQPVPTISIAGQLYND
jgi:dynein heavy chain